MTAREADTGSRALIRWISGPVLRARVEGPFLLREAIRVGPAGLLGEVIRLNEDEIVAQVYEDTTGLRPGLEVRGTGNLLGIRVGPGLLGNIYDGLLRPLQPADAMLFGFEPAVQAGAELGPGAPFGEVSSPRGRSQRALLPPNVAGRVAWIADAGEVTDDATVLRLTSEGGATHEVALSHFWPVRTPRPVRARLTSDEPLVTGQRILDSLFPVALGGKAAIPGGFGTGKTILLESLAKGCSADVIVYLGCGERGNEMAGVLEEFPQLDDPRTGRSLMERTVIIANTSNMPVAAREASIYSAVTVAEYFRDQGLHVALMADSTSRWAEALREVSGRFGELPGEGGYPTYLASRLADFYERAAKVRDAVRGDRFGDAARLDQSAIGRLFRAGHQPQQALRAQLLGARREARPGPLLPGGQPAAVVFGGLARRGGMVAEALCHGADRAIARRLGRERVARTATPLPDAARRPGAARAHGPHHRQGCAADPPAPDPARRRTRQRGLPSPVGVLAGRPLLRA